MEENQSISKNEQPKRVGAKEYFKSFLPDVARGFGMGIAFIIPGFSGGSVAAILGIYEKLIGAVADIFKHFKRSVLTLLPIFIGLVLGAVSLLFPLGWALDKFPLPTVSLFVGLALGGMPSITEKIDGKPKAPHLASLSVAMLSAIALCFAPTGADVDLLSLNFGGYLILFVIGIIGSSALVIPGISGSMLLLILGYYNPLIKIMTDNLLAGENVGKSILVLGSAGLGIIVGFFVISVIMKLLLEKCPKGTYFAIVGFIVGSLPTVYVSTAKDAGMTFKTLPNSPWHWVLCVALLVIGFLLAFLFVKKVGGKKKAKNQT